MTDARRISIEERLRHFVDAGHPDAEPLEAAVEGSAYRLGDGTAARFWDNRRVADLVRMQQFYAEAAARLPLPTPEILAVEDVDGLPVTVERELSGEPLHRFLSPEEPEPLPEAVSCLVEVLGTLANATDTDYLRQLPVLDEDRPLWEGQESFAAALAALLERRAERSRDALSKHVDAFDRRSAQVLEKLRALGDTPRAAVHGDLFPENILVDEDLRPTAVVDFGFLSTAGDPRFDAAVSAAIFTTSGPYAQNTADVLTARFADEFDYSLEHLLLYRAAYALATSDAFAGEGSDDHLRWCASVLNAPAVTAALEQST
ncbi:aminoglycoside phosphotransferase family protein [Actinacidiphila oryziradicis]|jgi:aminoglycoside phosphotransferase (APT) family kinase protein|uniref:phosphotransferase family protein n=1 Tax=Actinacidiphila oryziradicis TaxID=2571141 RepID=UPI0023F48EEF|nr:aminoglycoside phosphotransferase family protein [Actinacidiphila oryziradicis]MCW2873178.1 aminoglycoside phosphotransferase family protein [Actinacidiphila oryziradicis]